VRNPKKDFELATGARLDEVARDQGIRERRLFRADHGDGFGEIWESDACVRDRIRAKLEWDAYCQRR
jgi:hypothetical protein